MTTPDFKAALDKVRDDIEAMNTLSETVVMNYYGQIHIDLDDLLVIERALLIADKVMGEPSEGMGDAAAMRPPCDYKHDNNQKYYGSIFKAMRDEALKEIEQ